MITLIAGTNRSGSRTLALTKAIQTAFETAGEPVQLFSLSEFASWKRDEAFMAQEAQYLIPTPKFVFVLPEYNGSFPGIFKLMMDISDIKSCWYHKKVMLVGVSTGKAGNLRGLDVMTNMCHYLNMQVFHRKLPVSGIQHLMDETGHIHDAALNQLIHDHVQSYISF